MRVKASLFSLLIITFACGVLSARQVDTLVSRQVIYQGDTVLSSREGEETVWKSIGSANFSQAALVSYSGSSSYKWRFHYFYSVDNDGARFSLQTRLNLSSNAKPVFLVGWDAGRAGSRSAYTGWLQPNVAGIPAGAFPVSLTLMRDPASPAVTVHVQMVELEIWKSPEAKVNLNVQAADLGSVMSPLAGNTTQRPDRRPAKAAFTKQEALTTGISFLRAAAMGDTKTAMSFVSATPVDLNAVDSLKPASVPLLKLPNGVTFTDYLANYEPRVFSYAEFTGLFDDWESHYVKGWQVSAKSFLFIGSELKRGGKPILGDNAPVAFIVDEENGAPVVKAFPL